MVAKSGRPEKNTNVVNVAAKLNQGININIRTEFGMVEGSVSSSVMTVVTWLKPRFFLALILKRGLRLQGCANGFLDIPRLILTEKNLLKASLKSST
ncbi:hypothetical protein ABR40_02755 [Enterobacter kobei]|nr:hypothetical protein ABR40_02755 [Enterobacter kobei]